MSARQAASTLIGTVFLVLAGCASQSTTTSPYGAYYAFDNWLYHDVYWYDDPFWIWIDDHPGCCNDVDGLRDAMEDWWSGLDDSQKDELRGSINRWAEDNNVDLEGRQGIELVRDTAVERWSAMSPSERQQWVDGRHERIEQRRIQAPEAVSGLDGGSRAQAENAVAEARQRAAASDRSPDRARVGSHPRPSRANVQSGMRFRRR